MVAAQMAFDLEQVVILVGCRVDTWSFHQQ